MLIALLVPLAAAAMVYAFALARAAVVRRSAPKPEALLLGAVTNFFDTLGIGSFGPTISWLKFRGLVRDRLIPQTMLVGHTPPSITQGIIFLILLGVSVEPVLLAGCIVALVVGAVVGANLVTRSPAWAVQSIVGLALLVAAVFSALSSLQLMPAGGSANGLPWGLTVMAIMANFLFGILANFGVGNYAPTLAMLSLMGMDPRLSFPIMAGGTAFAGIAASTRHIALGEIDLRIATGIALGGIPAVLVAAFLVKSMPVETLRWLVIVVILVAAATMFRAARVGRREAEGRGKAQGGEVD